MFSACTDSAGCSSLGLGGLIIEKGKALPNSGCVQIQGICSQNAAGPSAGGLFLTIGCGHLEVF